MKFKNLADIIQNHLTLKGPITFAQFVEFALYHKRFGYYSSGKVRIGRSGDFYTSSSINKAFGETISSFIINALNATDADEFSILEIGAGTGHLALDILNSLQKISEIYKKVDYKIIEISEILASRAQKLLTPHIGKISFYNNFKSIAKNSINGVVISNELFDSLPFHRLKFECGKLFEIFVSYNDNFYELTDMVSTNKLLNYLKDFDIKFEENQEIEVNLESGRIFNKINNLLNQGFVLTIDYGYLADELFNPIRPKGTFLCYHKHTVNDNPYKNIGEQDITAHVDFTNLINIGEKLGLKTLKYTTQGQFLIDWGLLDIINGEEIGERDRRTIKNLFLPNQMGNKFKVLLQAKNLGDKIQNFYPESRLNISHGVT